MAVLVVVLLVSLIVCERRGTKPLFTVFAILDFGPAFRLTCYFSSISNNAVDCL